MDSFEPRNPYDALARHGRTPLRSQSPSAQLVDRVRARVRERSAGHTFSKVHYIVPLHSNDCNGTRALTFENFCKAALAIPVTWN